MQSQKIQVLIVDDEPTARRGVRLLLEREAWLLTRVCAYSVARMLLSVAEGRSATEANLSLGW